METPTTATAANPTDSPASTEASASTLATAGAPDAGKSQQTQTTETPAAEKPAGTPDGKPAAAPEAAAQKKDPPPAAAAPEKYEFKAPEGTEFDPDVLATYSDAVKEAGLTQDAAQKLIEKMAPALAARQADQVEAIHNEWREAASSDKEFGGEKLKENLGVAKKALDAFDPLPAGATTTPLRTLLDETGLGNHPEVIRMLFRAGKAISEDKFVGGSARGTGAVNPVNVLYDKTSAAKAS